MIKPFVIGIDFGTLSARAVLVDARNGRELASSAVDYPDGVIEERLPGSRKPLKPRSALQNPADYLTALVKSVRSLRRKARVRPDQIGAIGTDFTSCTVLPVRSDGTPLCFDRRLARNPHAWVKLWKHHAAQPEADRINDVGRARGEEFITAYGGKYSSEWFFSKVFETLREAPEIFQSADFFIEACDWIVWRLCGRQTRNVSAAGFKAMRVYPDSASGGWTYPAPDFFRDLHPDLAQVVSRKLGGPVIHLGARAGMLTESMARELNLPPGIPVAAGNIDAHAGVPACGVTRPGTLVMIMGTSTCHLLIAEHKQPVEGICGVVQDGIVPGFWGYEAGQAGVGDLFAWYVDHACPEYIRREAKSASIHDLLASRAGALAPGSAGLLALDWWNGNRSVLADADLAGLLLGLTIQTRPHEIYRALIEATAFGTRTIVEAFAARGIPVEKFIASGGLAQKNPVLMQIYADVLQRPIGVAGAGQASALGAAMWGAVAAGIHPDIHAAAARMARPAKRTYQPNAAHAEIYDRLYAEYARLHDYFGRDPNSPMKNLRRLRKT